MVKKTLEIKTSELVGQTLRKGDQVKLVINMGKHRIEMDGKVVNTKNNRFLEINSAHEIDIGGEHVFAKLQVIGNEKSNDANETIAAAALSGVEIFGKNTWLRGEISPILVRLTLQRMAKAAKDAEQYLRAAAIARVIPKILKEEYVISDIGPENVGKHAFDIFIISKRNPDQKDYDSILLERSIEQYLSRFGKEGIRTLARLHELLENTEYTQHLQTMAEKYIPGEYLNFDDYITLEKAFKLVLRDYPKSNEFWEGLRSDMLKEVNELRRLGVRGKTVENTRKYINDTLRRNIDWRIKIWHAIIMKKNLTKLWLYAMKRKGIIRFRNEEPPPRRVAPSRRP